ncbi:unnamed protein product [Prorocentrum cordatum]|uniref:Uncharacterized protein n=1 Tax=Prorocentrum cordatum TaxID=2364126 RepID=A0ABN9XXJ2_9DINO|nr:unnamed protein product [Polarella glacialis]
MEVSSGRPFAGARITAGDINKYLDLSRTPCKVNYKGSSSPGPATHSRPLWKNNNDPFQYDRNYLQRADIARGDMAQRQVKDRSLSSSALASPLSVTGWSQIRRARASSVGEGLGPPSFLADLWRPQHARRGGAPLGGRRPRRRAPSPSLLCAPPGVPGYAGFLPGFDTHKSRRGKRRPAGRRRTWTSSARRGAEPSTAARTSSLWGAGRLPGRVARAWTWPPRRDPGDGEVDSSSEEERYPYCYLSLVLPLLGLGRSLRRGFSSSSSSFSSSRDAQSQRQAAASPFGRLRKALARWCTYTLLGRPPPSGAALVFTSASSRGPSADGQDVPSIPRRRGPFLEHRHLAPSALAGLSCAQSARRSCKPGACAARERGQRPP